MSWRLFSTAADAEVPTQSHRLVLLKLVDCCDDDGRNIFPAVATVARFAKCSVRNAQRVIGEFCRIGLLRRVKDGGQGRGSTAHYEMDIDMLARLRRAELYPALVAAAHAEPLTDDDSEDGESHAPHAWDGEQLPNDSAQAKGDTTSPLPNDRVTPATAKGDKLSHPTPYRPLKPERESAGAGAEAQAGSTDVPDAGHAAEAGRPTPTLSEFIASYPHAAADDQIALASAWEALPFGERRSAVDGIPGFVAERKAAGFTSRLSAPKYLSGRNWQHVPKMATDRAAAQAAGAPVAVVGWSKDWWLLLLDRVFAGKPPGFWMQQAEANRPLSASGADIAAASKRVGALSAYLCTGPELAAWRPWLAARGARIPDMRGDARVFLPSPMPPGGRSEKGDDDVAF
ncbi:hypothetical protein ACFPOB_26120 [Bosea eneae]|uniref:Helix-turn-helix domain-containing protein n=1 Tax=Bosea eneae TaxID=151454 RepID=A0ABW0J0U3_9HYPH